jgi:hypothetical protein
MNEFIFLFCFRQSSNRIPRSTTTSTTTGIAASFPTGANGALDEEANSRAISVLQQMKEFTVESEDGDAAGSGGLFGELVISEPAEFQNRSFTSHLVELPWTERLLTQRVEESFYAGKHMVFCRKHDDQLAIVSNISYHHHPLAIPLGMIALSQNFLHSPLFSHWHLYCTPRLCPLFTYSLLYTFSYI